MKRQTRSLLEELESLAERHDESHVMENRGIHIIESAINFLNHVRETYDDSTAGELERRLINSIRGRDSKKFQRAIRKSRDN